MDDEKEKNERKETVIWTFRSWPENRRFIYKHGDFLFIHFINMRLNSWNLF